MSVDTWISLASTALVAIGGLIAGIRIVEQMGAKIALVKQDLENHKYNHARLELKVADHENKIDERLKEMNEKIDDNHTVITDKLTDIKVAIEQLKK